MILGRVVGITILALVLSGTAAPGRNPPPPPDDQCSGAIVLPSCATGTLSGDTSEYTNDYDPGEGGCTDGYAEVGNDMVYAVDLEPGFEIDMTYTQLQLDGAIYVVTDCSDVAGSCVAGADATVAGQPERLRYIATERRKYYIILDSYTPGGGPWTMDYWFPNCPPPPACCFPDGHCELMYPPDCWAMGGIPQGEGTTCETVDCTPVATTPATWGRIKSGYR